MRTALIGSTGFIGGELKTNYEFTDIYNSKNIKEIKDKIYDVVVCAAPSSNKLLANRRPDLDLESINVLLDSLKELKCQYFIFVSTISTQNEEVEKGYGKNRLYLEKELEKLFSNITILHLPAVYGENAKKGMMRDLSHGVPLYLMNLKDSSILANYYAYSEQYELYMWNEIDTDELRKELEKLNISSAMFWPEEVRNVEKIHVSDVVQKIITLIGELNG